MRTTFFQLGLALALVGIAATAMAAAPNDAGFKARGMKPALQRTYAAPQMFVPQATARQAFSVEPQAAPKVDCAPVVAKAPAAAPAQVRRYSYEPSAPAPVYRTWNRRAATPGYLGGNYPSKANLKY